MGYAITALGTALEFDGTQGQYNVCHEINSSKNYINFWSGSGNDGYVQCL